MSLQVADFEALTFDCYGTLIDWESGLVEALSAWLDANQTSIPRNELLEAFARVEPVVEHENPTLPYRLLLEKVIRVLSVDLEVPVSNREATAFGCSVAHWPAFDDSTAALQRLARSYKLVIVSNVDRQSFAGSQRRLGIAFDAVITAEDVGAYKPDEHFFHHAFDVIAGLGVARERILHVAQSLYHDHVPARNLGMSSVWIDRRQGQEGWGATAAPEVEVVPDLVVTSLMELADLDDRQRGEAVAG